MKKLKINLQVPIITECWTFYRLAILSTSNQFENWFLNHFNNITMNGWTSLRYGRYGQVYNQFNYYNDLLETRCYNLNNICSENQLYNLITERIENNQYILMECDFSYLFNEQLERNIHEILIFGYDDKNIYCVNLVNRVWKEIIIEFEKLYEAFLRRKNLDFDAKSKLDLGLRQYLYPITILKLKNNKIEPDLFAFRYDVSESYYYSKKSPNSDHAYYTFNNNKYWEGACGVFYGLIEFINDYLENKYGDNKLNIVVKFKKLYEFHSLFVQKIKAFDELYNINLPDYLYEIYNSVIDTLDVCFALSIKYNETGCVDDLLSIKNHLIEKQQTTQHIFGDLLVRLNEFLIKNWE